MLTDQPRDLNANKNLTLINETMYLDLTSLSIPLGRHRKFEKADLNKLNNNVEHKKDGSYHIKSTAMMPPPSNKIFKYQNGQNQNQNNKAPFRTQSPKGYDSDESCASCLSLIETASPAEGLHSTNTKNGVHHLNESTKKIGKHSHSTPNVYQSNFYYQHNNNGTFTKNRQNINSKPKNQALRHPAATDMMLRRAHGLVERFRSKSKVMKINPNPPALLTGSGWDPLNQAIWDVFSSKAQQEKTYEMKINLWKHIFLFIRKGLNSYGLFMVGSTMSGFGLDTSDIDMCLLTKPFTNDPRLDAVQHLNTVRQLLLRYEVAVETELILAKVPILKFREKESGFEIDLNCNNSVGIRNTHLLYTYSKLDWRVRPLVVLVKFWAQTNNINDAKNMTVSSYSFALMVIHFLQCGVSPPVLPCLHHLVPEKFNNTSEHHTMDVQEDIEAVNSYRTDNTACLGELLLGFLHYYSYFNFNQHAISVRAGCRLPIDDCRFIKAPKNDPNQWRFLCIEEPFDFTNTARSVLDLEKFKYIKDVIVGSYRELERTRSLQAILPVNFHHFR